MAPDESNVRPSNRLAKEEPEPSPPSSSFLPSCRSMRAFLAKSSAHGQPKHDDDPSKEWNHFPNNITPTREFERLQS